MNFLSGETVRSSGKLNAIIKAHAQMNVHRSLRSKLYSDWQSICFGFGVCILLYFSYHLKGKKIRMKPKMSSSNDTVYLCNFRVSVNGDWLCLKELHDLQTCEVSSIPARSHYCREAYGVFFLHRFSSDNCWSWDSKNLPIKNPYKLMQLPTRWYVFICIKTWPNVWGLFSRKQTFWIVVTPIQIMIFTIA